jgi:hypothetical protein
VKVVQSNQVAGAPSCLSQVICCFHVQINAFEHCRALRAAPSYCLILCGIEEAKACWLQQDQRFCCGISVTCVVSEGLALDKHSCKHSPDKTPPLKALLSHICSALINALEFRRDYQHRGDRLVLLLHQCQQAGGCMAAKVSRRPRWPPELLLAVVFVVFSAQAALGKLLIPLCKLQRLQLSWAQAACI